MNVIAPDNKEKKLKELRSFMFPTQKTKAECKEEKIEYDPSIHQIIV